MKFCILIKFQTALEIIISETRAIFLENILQSYTKDIVIQTEIIARKIIFLSMSSCCCSTCQLRDENMRGKFFALCHISPYSPCCQGAMQGVKGGSEGQDLSLCPQPGSRQAWGTHRGTTSPGHQAAVLSRISHPWACLCPGGCHPPAHGWVPAGQTGGDWQETRTSWELWHGISKGVAGEVLCFPARVIPTGKS